MDIAAPIGTPIYAAHSGVVVRAGAATGFGLAVYIKGDDGAVTVYGHVNEYFVRAGERVSAGEQIAEVGNRGQSTGPHLHFEVHPSGVTHGGQVDPATGDFVFGVSEGYLIEGGKVTSPCRGATLIGNCLEALAAIDAVGDDFFMKTGICGKGGQKVPVGTGQGHVRVRAMRVGGTER